MPTDLLAASQRTMGTRHTISPRATAWHSLRRTLTVTAAWPTMLGHSSDTMLSSYPCVDVSRIWHWQTGVLIQSSSGLAYFTATASCVLGVPMCGCWYSSNIKTLVDPCQLRLSAVVWVHLHVMFEACVRHSCRRLESCPDGISEPWMVLLVVLEDARA
jgi:hypothetical protein